MNKETNTPVEFIFVPDEFGGAPYSLLPYEFPWTMTETRANQTGFGDVERLVGKYAIMLYVKLDQDSQSLL